MEKLQPLIVHRFWIFFGLALLLPTYGWFAATGELAGAIDELQNKVESGFSSVPKDDGINKNPNHIRGLQKINKVQVELMNEAADLLKSTQQGLRVWPRKISKMMEGVPYRGKAANNDPRELYQTAYFREIDKLPAIVVPFDHETEQGKVILKLSTITPLQPRGKWDRSTPRWSEMWDAQEDIWLFRELLASIRDVNVNAKSILDAPIKRIDKIALRGGKRTAVAKAADEGGSGGGDSEETEAEVGGDEDEGGEGNLNELGGGRGGGGADVGGNVTINIGDLLGGGVGIGGKAPIRRYVDDDPQLPFKTRAFYLVLVMDHSKIPDLIVELTNSKWPVHILQVHYEGLHSDNLLPASGPGRQAPNARGVARGFVGFKLGRGGRGIQFQNRFRSGGNRSGRAQKNNAASIVQAAMSDPSLANVHVVGLLTLFDPPDVKTSLASTSAASANSAQQPPPSAAANGNTKVQPDSLPPESTDENPQPDGDPSAEKQPDKSSTTENENNETPADDPADSNSTPN